MVKIPVTSSGIKYSASVDGNAKIKQDGDYLIITPDKDYNGKILVNLNLDMSFILNVQSVNDKPKLLSFQDKRINEDEVFNIELEATDAERDELTYGATADNGAFIKIVKNNLTVKPKENFLSLIHI